MPEALARTDFDYSVSSSRRSKGITRIRKDGLLAGMRRVGITTIIAAGFVAVAITAVVNALILQDGPHPAPLFAGSEPAPANVLPRVAPALPPERPVEAAQTPPAEPVQPAAVAAKPRPRAVVPPATVAAAPAGPKDGIGDFLRAGAVPATATADNSATILAVQKALVRAGHDIGKPNGRLGPATRQAIEKFERERKLPVTGDLSARLLRELNIPPAKI